MFTFLLMKMTRPWRVALMALLAPLLIELQWVQPVHTTHTSHRRSCSDARILIPSVFRRPAAFCRSSLTPLSYPQQILYLFDCFQITLL